jgi:protein-disulfide isomerase
LERGIVKKKGKNNSRKYIFIIIPILIASIGIGAFAFSQEGKQKAVTNEPAELILGGSPMLGDPNASVTVVEWGDYQCTYCYRFHENTKDIVFANFVDNGKIRFAFRDFTLNGPASVLAAEASYCAGDQNNYWAYHDELYKNWEGENTGWVTMDNLKKFALNVGLDIDIFDKCMQSNKYKQKVLDNYKYGQSIGVNATPTFIIIDKEGDARVIRGAQPYTIFDQVLNEMLRDT